MTYERRTIIETLPNGNQVVRCENRGYDSPDKWIEVVSQGKCIKEFGIREREKAIQFAGMTACS